MGRTLILGASGGIGGALARPCAPRGEDVTALSRSVDGFDTTDEDSVAHHLGGLAPFDRIVVATGALEIAGAEPEKTVKAIRAQAMADQFALNAIGPALVLSHAHSLLPRDRRAVFAVLTARVGSIGDNRLGGWYAYRGAKAAQNMFTRTLSVEWARSRRNVICVALHPGTTDTALSRPFQGNVPPEKLFPAERTVRQLLAVIDGLRPTDSGRFLAWDGSDIPW